MSIEELSKILNEKIKSEDRIIFKGGFQKKFLIIVKENSKLTWGEISNIFNINPYTIRHDYLHEIYSMPVYIVAELLSYLHPPVKIKKWVQEIQPKNWGQRKGGLKALAMVAGRKGAKVRIKKLRIQRLRFIKNNLEKFDREMTEKPPKLNIKSIKLSEIDRKKELKLPEKLTPLLAEEIGIHIGDGYLGKKNKFRLGGDKNEERLYYDQHIIPLYKKLYNLKITPFIESSVYGFEVYSKGLSLFKHETIGLPLGSKARTITLPKIIVLSKNKDIICSCIRGISDTDFSLSFLRGKYPSISANLASKQLIMDLSDLLKGMGFIVSVSIERNNYYRLTLYGEDNLNHWVKLIGWNNPKHLTKFKIWKKYGYCPPNTTINERIEILKSVEKIGVVV